MRRFRTSKLGAKLLALVTILGVVSPTHGAPGDVMTMPAPMLGADPPKATDLRDGDASVATQTGALTYTYPIQVPPGRLGTEPKLALSYSSQASIYGGIAAGWSLSVPEIRLDTTEGILRQAGAYHDPRAEKKFVSTMAGSRPLVEVSEPTSSGVYATFRAQNDTSYARYEWMQPGQPLRWRAYGSDGTVYRFGETGLVTGSIEDERVPLTSTEDAFGNRVEYRWQHDGDGDYRLQDVRYNIHVGAGLGASARVVFTWETMPSCLGDVAIGAAESYRTGEVERSGQRRLAAVTAEAFNPATAAVEHRRVITLGYEPKTENCTEAFAAFRELRSIQESAWHPANPSARVDLPAIKFDYGSATHDWTWDTYGGWPTDADGGLTWGRRFNSSQWPDVRAMFIDLDGAASSTA